MAEKLPVILDNRNDNTVLNALQKLLPSLQKIDIATGIFEVGCPTQKFIQPYKPVIFETL